MDTLKEIVSGFNSLVTGMRITLGQFFKPIVTVQYPRETLEIPERFRGHIELVRDPATGKALCFACKVCEKSCPSDCITVDGAKLEGEKRKSVSEFQLDFTKCSLCGSCVEACKSGAIRFSREYNLASTRKEDFIMNLFQRLENERVESEPSSTAFPSSTTPASGPAPVEAVQSATRTAEPPKVEAPKPATTPAAPTAAPPNAATVPATPAPQKSLEVP